MWFECPCKLLFNCSQGLLGLPSSIPTLCVLSSSSAFSKWAGFVSFFPHWGSCWRETAPMTRICRLCLKVRACTQGCKRDSYFRLQFLFSYFRLQFRNARILLAISLSNQGHKRWCKTWKYTQFTDSWLFRIPSFRTKSSGQRSLCCRAPVIWNTPCFCPSFCLCQCL